jgi:hypothetical protein
MLLRPEEDTGLAAPEEPKAPPRPEPPPFSLPALPRNKYGKAGPSAGRVEADCALAERVHQQRNSDIQDVHDLYFQVSQQDKGRIRRRNPYQQRVVIPSTPTTMGDRAIGLVAPTIDRLTYHLDPRDDAAATRDAAQMVKNAARTIREELSRRHTRRISNDGHVRAPLERIEGGTMTLEGTMPALIDMNPDDEHFPFLYEPLGVHEVYPLGHATLRIYFATLGELRSAWPDQVDEAYPLDTGDSPRGGAGGYPGEESQVKVIGWSDELWHGILASIPTSGKSRRGATKDQSDAQGRIWLKPMARHDNGFRVYQYGVPALGSPLTPTGTERDVSSANAIRGIFAAYMPLFRLQGQLLSATADGAFKAVNPAYAITLATAGDTPPTIDDSPGGKGVVLKPAEKIAPLLHDIMASPSGQALLQAISGMIGEMMPPVTQGRGQAASGADRFIAQQQAAALHIDPLINGLEATVGYYLSLLMEGFYRKSTGSKRWLKGFPVRQRLRRPGEEQRGATLAMLTPDDIDRCGTDVVVRFKRYSVSERAQLGAMLKGMVDAKFISRMDAMDELDVEDYERTVARMLFEAIYDDPDMVKASIDAIVEEQLDPEMDPGKRGQRRAIRLQRAWRRRQAAQRGPTPPGPPGQVSPPGLPEQPPLPGLPAAGVAV